MPNRVSSYSIAPGGGLVNFLALRLLVGCRLCRALAIGALFGIASSCGFVITRGRVRHLVRALQIGYSKARALLQQSKTSSTQLALVLTVGAFVAVP